MNNIVNLLMGLDLGNGYVKGSAIADGSNQRIDIDYESVVALAVNPVSSRIAPKDKQDVEAAINDIFNYLDVSFSSDLILEPYRHIFGYKGIVEYGNSIRQYNINSVRLNKTENVLSYILCLGTVAGVALKDYYAKNSKLPDTDIDVNVNLALSLPIDEYIHDKKIYPEKLCKNSRHTVNIHNFNIPQKTIHINIKFDNVTVLAEGSAAQLAISQNKYDFVYHFLKQASKTNADWATVTADDIIASENIIGIDIGEGTVNYPVFWEGRFSSNLSSVLKKGYGSVIDNAIRTTEMETGLKLPMYYRRNEIFNLINEELVKIPKLQQEIAKKNISKQKNIFAEQIIERLSSILSEIGSINVVYVYGGGAHNMKDDLDSAGLASIVAKSNPSAPIIFAGPDSCRKLNSDGLFKLVSEQFKQKSKPIKQEINQ